jgi:hypothetical protein
MRERATNLEEAGEHAAIVSLKAEVLEAATS